MKKRQINIAKRVDHSCRNNGTCAYCTASRLHQVHKEEAKANDKLKERDYEDESILQE